MDTTNKLETRTEDARLLARFVSNGDEEAFAKLVRKYESLVWNICCRVLHNRCDAEDAFQLTFLLLATKAHRIRKPNSLSSWLYGSAFRTANSVRRSRKGDVLPYENSVDEKLTEDVLELVARKHENEMVGEEILSLKERYRTPLLMFYFMGDSVSLIAETLGITVSTVEGRLRQGRQALRVKLKLRGVEFNDCCVAVMVVPIMAFSPALPSITITQVLATFANSGTTWPLSSFLSEPTHLGVKLMLAKVSVTIGILCVSFGMIYQGAANSAGDQSARIACDENPPRAAQVLEVNGRAAQVSESPDVQVKMHIGFQDDKTASDEIETTITEVPFLSNLPFIGVLFQRVSTTPKSGKTGPGPEPLQHVEQPEKSR